MIYTYVSYSVSGLDDVVANHLHIARNDSLELWHLTNLVTDEGVGERSNVVTRDTHAKIETIVTRELKQVEKCWSSILFGIKLQVELVNEDEAIVHECTLLSRQLWVLSVD